MLEFARPNEVDFINRLRGLSLRLRQQGFESNLLQKSFNKFFNRHGLIVESYGAALREMRLQSRLELHHRILTSLIYE